MDLEHAIPADLQVPRTQPHKTPDNYQPPFPAYCARFPQDVKNLVMAVIGAQSRKGASQVEPSDFSSVVDFIRKSPSHVAPFCWDICSVRDNQDAHNLAVIAYWPSRDKFDVWCKESSFDEWWSSPDRESNDKTGWFKEVFFPQMDQFETVFSDNVVPEGAARMRESMSGPVQQHVYWGSMRDRLPISQTDPLIGDAWEKKPTAATNGHAAKRVKVPGWQNLCIIRSGQDWSNTTPHEREKYLTTMHPVLIRGMDFLRDEGADVGCFSCRFMDVHDDETRLADTTERTFGLAYFNDMASLEKWSKGHKTHLDIFGRFLQYAGELQSQQGQVSLRLFHEVLVLKPEQQQFEYIGCHPGSGMMAGIGA